MKTPAEIIQELFQELEEQLGGSITDIAWWDWHGFWLEKVLLGADSRFIVCFFLPLVPVLLLFSRRHLLIGVVLTSFVFLAYLFGALFVPFWLAMCAGFYWLSERYAVDLKRRDRLWWNPSVVVVACMSVWYVISLRLNGIRFPADWNFWLFHQVPWLFPLGGRKIAWETYFMLLPADIEQNPPPLFFAMFYSPQTCGLVIFTCRMIHYFSEIKRGMIPRARRTFLRFLAFNSFAPTVMQGPIERFKDFDEGIERCHEHRAWGDLLAGLLRIAVGLSKNLFSLLYLGLPVLKIIYLDGYYEAPQQIESYAVLFFCIHLQVLILYLMFSGYCDVAIGLARLVGYRAAENFKRPWLARSLTDMWRRWHITLSFILRDYVFLPLARRRWKLVPNLVVTFVICGILHNFNPNYIVWGVIMGLMVAVNQKWGRWMRALDRAPQRRLSAVRRAWLKLQPLPKLCAWFLTINVFVLSGLICLAPAGRPGGFRVLWELLRRPAVWLAGACGLM